MRVDVLAVGPLTFRHEPAPAPWTARSPATFTRPPGLSDVANRSAAGALSATATGSIMPAFGAYAGGLDVLDRAFAGLFRKESFRAFVLGDERVYAVGRRALRADR